LLPNGNEETIKPSCANHCLAGCGTGYYLVLAKYDSDSLLPDPTAAFLQLPPQNSAYFKKIRPLVNKCLKMPLCFTYTNINRGALNFGRNSHLY
jgi:hypothetical protein